ncbi:hypothetical protein [Peribacillus sp. CSMR9]|uniref:hypothetical protein n=1 Tax=Peribacillus sp. CSMR9 TaxID=2981350 RepID=UPI0029534D7F|nr:hypothetical protein [Peribacillus sp. CSMR9]MDV7766192.1 hypothetical protein [Peribacillus sp. CSMR9]
MDNKTQLAFILVLIPLAISIFICFKPELLISGGYDSALVIFTLHLLVKLGEFIINKKNSTFELIFFVLFFNDDV